MGEGDSGELVKSDSNELTTIEREAQIAQLRHDIEAKRQRIRDSIDSLQDEIEDAIDWKGWVRENPWKTMGFAFAVGFLWGSG